MVHGTSSNLGRRTLRLLFVIKILCKLQEYSFENENICLDILSFAPSD